MLIDIRPGEALLDPEQGTRPRVEHRHRGRSRDFRRHSSCRPEPRDQLPRATHTTRAPNESAHRNEWREGRLGRSEGYARGEFSVTKAFLPRRVDLQSALLSRLTIGSVPISLDAVAGAAMKLKKGDRAAYWILPSSSAVVPFVYMLFQDSLACHARGSPTGRASKARCYSSASTFSE